jgi:hypothetical protein
MSSLLYGFCFMLSGLALVAVLGFVIVSLEPPLPTSTGLFLAGMILATAVTIAVIIAIFESVDWSEPAPLRAPTQEDLRGRQ